MELTKPVIAALLLVHSCALAQSEIHLKSRSGTHTLPGKPVQNRPPNRGHFILHFNTYPGLELRNELAQRGILVLGYVPDNGLMVSAGVAADLAGLPLASTDALQVSDKISPAFDNQVSGHILAIFYGDVDVRRQHEIATSVGFDIVANAGLLANQLVLTGPLTRLPALAAFDEVSYLLPASADLAAGAPVAGCPGALTEAGLVGEYVLVSKGWSKDSSGKVTLAYFIRSLTEKINPDIARAEIERALMEWTKYADFTLTAGQQGGARTVDILFGRGAHGDLYPFDGAGGTLAHTFYPSPPNPEPIAGDMHLDADESWNTGARIDLYSVALHEMGHALGLGHSDRPGAVMYPYYRQVTGLSDDDIAGVQAIYGAPGTTTPVSNPPVTNPPVTNPPVTNPPVTNPPVTNPPVTTPTGSDTLAPTLQITSPGRTIYSTTAASIPVSGTASDNVAVARVQWGSSSGDSGTATGTDSWSVMVPLLIGNNVVTVRAYDAAGNSGWRTVTIVRR